MPTPPTLTEEVATFITATRYTDLPAEVVRLTKRMLIDGTAVMLAGPLEESHRVLTTYLRGQGGAPQATVLGAGFAAPAQFAALANGLAGHAHDYDDTQLSTAPSRVYGLLTHPTTPVLGAAYPLAELLDNEHNYKGAHVDSLDAQKAKVLNPALTPSHKVLEAVRELGSFAKFGLQQSKLHAQAFRAEALMPAEVAVFDEMAQASLDEQRQIEQTDTGSFDDFVAAYNSSTLCCNS